MKNCFITVVKISKMFGYFPMHHSDWKFTWNVHLLLSTTQSYNWKMVL